MTLHVCRVGDLVVGVCQAGGADHPRNFIGTWLTGSDTTSLDGLKVVRVGDTGTTDCGHVFQAVEGSGVACADGSAQHRIGDLVYVIEDGVGVSITGSLTGQAN